MVFDKIYRMNWIFLNKDKGKRMKGEVFQVRF